MGPLVTDDEQERAARRAHVQQAEVDFEPLPFDAAAARGCGHVAADLRSAGRTTRVRAYDALIAAIAVARRLPLYTVDPGDFDHISELEVVAVPPPVRHGLTPRRIQPFASDSESECPSDAAPECESGETFECS